MGQRRWWMVLSLATLGSKWRQNKRWINGTIEGIPIYEVPISISAFYRSNRRLCAVWARHSFSFHSVACSRALAAASSQHEWRPFLESIQNTHEIFSRIITFHFKSCWLCLFLFVSCMFAWLSSSHWFSSWHAAIFRFSVCSGSFTCKFICAKEPAKSHAELDPLFSFTQLTISLSKRCFLGELSEFDYSGARDTFTVINFIHYFAILQMGMNYVMASLSLMSVSSSFLRSPWAVQKRMGICQNDIPGIQFKENFHRS